MTRRAYQIKVVWVNGEQDTYSAKIHGTEQQFKKKLTDAAKDGVIEITDLQYVKLGVGRVETTILIPTGNVREVYFLGYVDLG